LTKIVKNNLICAEGAQPPGAAPHQAREKVPLKGTFSAFSSDADREAPKKRVPDPKNRIGNWEMTKNGIFLAISQLPMRFLGIWDFGGPGSEIVFCSYCRDCWLSIP